MRNYDKASDEVTTPIRHGYEGKCSCSSCNLVLVHLESDLGAERMDWEGGCQ